jgi:hypothetical protein
VPFKLELIRNDSTTSKFLLALKHYIFLWKEINFQIDGGGICIGTLLKEKLTVEGSLQFHNAISLKIYK